MTVEHRTILNLKNIKLKLQEIASTAHLLQVTCWTRRQKNF